MKRWPCWRTSGYLYTWLEQGRDVNPSSAVMAAVAKARNVPRPKRAIFLCWPGYRPGEAPQATCCEGISEGTRRLLDTLMPKPASIQKPNFDIVAWNDSFGHLMGVDFNAIPPEDRNCIYLFLTHPAWRARLGRRDDVCPSLSPISGLAMAEHRGDPLWEAKLARFFAVSEEFKNLWHQRNDVRGVENQLKLFTHPELGEFTLQQMYWYSAPRNGSRLLVYLPVDEAGERAMEWLTEQAKEGYRQTGAAATPRTQQVATGRHINR